LDYRVLGPVEVWAGGKRLPFNAAKPNALLALGLVNAGRVVSADRIVDAIWTDPPATAQALVQSYVSTLRRELARAGAPDVIVTRSPGYVFQIPAGELDLSRFESGLADGRRAAARGDHATAAELLRAALECWRGPALDGLGADVLRAEARRLDELRLAAQEERIAAELELGREAELVAELTGLLGAHPLRERPRAALMLTLYRLGRRAEALDVYREGVEVLRAELGLDPGDELTRLHTAILRGDPALTPAGATPRNTEAPSSTDPATGASDQPPAQLPAAIDDLIGRQEELGRIEHWLVEHPGTAAPVCAISGAAGNGKTALAVYAAQAISPSFPDGQLYVALRGADRTTAVEPREVLGALLRALGVAQARLPTTTDERAALYRSTLANRRVLIVLDDAGSEQQVRPLLPAQPGCAVLVTSRARLSGLERANHLSLDVLDRDSAIELLAAVAGTDRVGAQQEDAREIVRLCGYLPLALRTVAVRLAARSHWPLAVLATRLGDEQRRLDELAVGDLAVRASLALSYRELSEPERRCFRLLAVLNVPDFAPWIVAPLLDRSPAEAEQLVERLADAQLLDFAGHHDEVRYRMHDLVRLYAGERAAAEDSPEERRAAVDRVLRCWLVLLDELSTRVPSGLVSLRRVGAEAAHRSVAQETVAALAGDPTRWFATERATLVAAIIRGSDLGLDETACELAAVVSSSTFRLYNHFDEWWRTHDAALAAARRAGNRRGEAVLQTGLGQLRYEQDRFAEASAYFLQALTTFRDLHDQAGEAAAQAGLGAAARDSSHLAEALHYLVQARTLFDRLGDDSGVATTAYDIGVVHRDTGDLPEALADFDQALRIYRRLGVRRGEGLTLRAMGLVHRAAGELAYAEELSTQAVAVLRETGDQLAVAYGVQALAKVWIRQGRGSAARQPLLDCLETCRELHDGFGAALVLRTLGELHLAAGELGLAESYLTTALASWEELGLPAFRARTLRDLADLHTRRGDLAAAQATRSEALEAFRTLGGREYAELLPEGPPAASHDPATRR
jgi:DNA-binding SARP family transcriptional activator